MNNSYLNRIKKNFEAKKNPEKAKPMKKYMKDLFEFYGIPSPERKEIYRTFFRDSGLPPIEELEEIIMELWAQPQREYQYFGIFLLEKVQKKLDKDKISLFEYIIINRSWWDSVDGIASNLIGPFFKKFPELIEPYTKKWLASNNMWLQRTVLLFQLNYKKETDENLLYDAINILKDSDEFFIQKAIGWVLREYSKSYPEKVTNFINNTDLAPLSRREGLKVINRSNKPV